MQTLLHSHLLEHGLHQQVLRK